MDFGPPVKQLLIAWRYYYGKEEGKKEENCQKENRQEKNCKEEKEQEEKEEINTQPYH